MPSWTKAPLPSIDIYKPTILQGSILDIKEVLATLSTKISGIILTIQLSMVSRRFITT